MSAYGVSPCCIIVSLGLHGPSRMASQFGFYSQLPISAIGIADIANSITNIGN